MQNSISPGTIPPTPPGPINPQPAPAQPMVIQATPYRPPTPQVTLKTINHQAVLLGSAQIVLGVLCIAFNAVAIALESSPAYGGSGIWAGLFFIVTGPFGIAAGKRRTRGWYITYMVLSIISAVFTIGVITQSGLGLGLTEDYTYWGYICPTGPPVYPPTTTRWYGDGCDYGIIGYRNRGAILYFHSSLLICGILEAIIAIYSSVLCCRAVCCRRTSGTAQSRNVICYQAGNQMISINGQPMILVNQGQPGVMYAMPITQQVASVVPQQQQMAPLSSPVAVPPYNPQQAGERTPPPTYQEQGHPIASEEKRVLPDYENPDV